MKKPKPQMPQQKQETNQRKKKELLKKPLEGNDMWNVIYKNSMMVVNDYSYKR